MTKDQQINMMDIINREVIKKWIQIRDAKVAEDVTECHWCTCFLTCAECPMYELTGESQCHGTGYWKWWEHQNTHVAGIRSVIRRRVRCEECVNLAQKVLDNVRAAVRKWNKSHTKG